MTLFELFNKLNIENFLNIFIKLLLKVFEVEFNKLNSSQKVKNLISLIFKNLVDSSL